MRGGTGGGVGGDGGGGDSTVVTHFRPHCQQVLQRVYHRHRCSELTCYYSAQSHTQSFTTHALFTLHLCTAHIIYHADHSGVLRFIISLS